MATTQVATRTPTPQQKLKTLLDGRAEEFGKALAGRVDPDAFVRVAFAAVTKTPKLMRCTRESLMMALMESAALGLTPNGVTGEAYVVPYGDQAQFQIGYRGLVKLARQSGVIRNIVPRAVFEGDHFEVEYGVEEKITHRPSWDADDTEKPTHVYAVAYFTDGSVQFEVMSRRAVDKIRARSQSANNGPWVTDYTEMALKTVVRRLCKRLPLSDFDLARALEADNKDYGEIAMPPIGAAGLTARLAAVPATAPALPPAPMIPADEPEDRVRALAQQVEREMEESGELDPANEIPQPEPWDEEAASAEDPTEDGAYFALLAAAEKLVPEGGEKLAGSAYRKRLREHARTIYGADSAEAYTLETVSGHPELSQGQVEALLALAKRALEEGAQAGAA